MSNSAISGPILSDTRRASAGTAAAPSFAFNDSTGTGVYLVSPGVLGLSTAGVQRVVVDASGNVGIGTSTPQARLDLGNASGERLRLYSTARIGFGVDMGGTFGNSAFTNHSFNWGLWDGTTWTERMRIDASGRLLVGGITGPLIAGSSEKLQVNSAIITDGYRTKGSSFGMNTFNINWTGSAQLWIDGTNVGTFAFTSDYRIKKNIETQEQPALERIAQLRPVKYELADYKELFKADGVQREGFIAHELQAVIPSAVEGEKDAEEQIQSLKLDALCSVMVKAIQEQQEIIGKLEARLAALEAK